MRIHTAFGMAVLLAGLCAGAGQKQSGKNQGKQPQAQTERVMPFGGTTRAQSTDKAKAEDPKSKAEEPKTKAEAPPNLRAFDEGDQVRFESRLPFGVSQYRKKKSELNEVERAALERERKSKPAGQ
ncbi:MAG: hypothetical protein IT159_15595 [Bryobacterales bacterium]|nr:hypothetical protein [Bryobacterales bacterium]